MGLIGLVGLYGSWKLLNSNFVERHRYDALGLLFGLAAIIGLAACSMTLVVTFLRP